MNKNNKLPALVAIILLITSGLTAQQTQETVILYNSQPVQVELSEMGKILSFYGLKPGYMTGFQLENAVVKIEPIVIDNVNPTFTDESQNAEYAILSKERVMLNFDKGFATLSAENIKILNEVSRKLKNGDFQKAVITSFTNGQNSKLVENRLESAVTYLNIKGIQRSQLITEVQESNNQGDLTVIFTN